MDAVLAIQIAVARADLALCAAALWARTLLPGLLAGGMLWGIIRREARK